MGPIWAHLGTSLVHYWIPCGSETGPLWAYLELIWILRGSLRDPPWVKLDPNLGLVGSLVDLPCFRMGLDWAHIGTLAGPSGILDGSTLDPTWNQLGSYLDPSWIHDGDSLAHLGTYRFFHGLSFGSRKGLWHQLGPYCFSTHFEF